MKESMDVIKEFERDVKTRQEEDFDVWDDYIEWRAYLKALGELEGRIKEIENAQDIDGIMHRITKD